MTISIDSVVDAYIQTRDLIEEKKKAFDAEVAELKDLQDRREKYILGSLDKLGVESFKTAHGTAFIDWKDSATVKDRESFFAWVEADFENHKHYLESRVSKTAVKQGLEDGAPPPPGVDYVRVKDLKVRRK
jgi:hypothetical protein